ncbi:MAG: hypothetical protein EP344_14465 [Bacteroidetes bacterium]|nr:MAG: hypothetical protein EP344_14465 [Bacteroidota bacterium]
MLFFIYRYLNILSLVAAVALGTAGSLTAQKTRLPETMRDTAVSNLFDKDVRLKWIRFYRGRFDDVSDVVLSLGYDGTNCRGYLTYTESNERFKLLGTLDGIVLVLEEIDKNGQVSGRLMGTLQDQLLDVDWANASNTLGSRLEAEVAASDKSIPGTCGDNKWVRRYIARWSNARVDFTLARVHNGTLNGYLWIEADNRTYTLTGKIFKDNKMELQALLPNGRTAAQLSGFLDETKGIDLNWIGSGEKRTLKMIQRYKFQVGCLEYADYTSSYDALYPRTTECAGCNQSLDQLVAEWVEKCKVQMSQMEKSAVPENRNALRASAWYEVTCWTETIFCGYLTFAASWEPEMSGRSFNYDLRTGKEITFEDLFNRSFKSEEWFTDFARKESPKMAKFAADPQFREWLQADGFPLFTIRRDGLELSTLFHPVYGQYSLTVPYSTLKPYMRRDNPIADLVK